MNTYLIVCPDNLQEVSERLKRNEGHIILARRGHTSFKGVMRDIIIYFFKNASVSQERILTKRDRNHKDDIYYLLRRIPKPTGDISWDSARGLFASLVIRQTFEFKIGATANIGLVNTYHDEHDLVIFVPTGESVEPAFLFVLTEMIERLNASSLDTHDQFLFSQQDVQNILSYIMEDWKTGKILQRNMEVCGEADALTE